MLDGWAPAAHFATGSLLQREMSVLDEEIIPLAEAFGAPSREAWLALVDKTLKGGSIDKLTSKTRDGIAIAPLYRSGDGAASPVRGPLHDPERAWDLRCETRHPKTSRANTDILKDLEGGAASVLIRIDPSGLDGVAVGSQADLAKLLDGVLLDLAPVALDAGWMGPEAADWLGALAKAAPNAPLQFHLDPLSVYALTGESPGPINSHLVSAATVATRLVRTYPKAGLFLATGRVVHEAGGSEAEELAFAAASALEYAKALTRAGMTIAEAFSRITLGVALDGDYFVGIAKIRALRLVFAKIATASGAPAVATIEARSSNRMLATYDAWTNLIRLAAAGFAGAVGGADAIVLAPFTDAIGLPSDLARRQARNTQLVLMEESHLARVADPAGGAWFLEKLTGDIARAAWDRFQAIEAAGGIVAALESGLIAGQAAKTLAARRTDIAKRKQGLVGVSEFPSLGETPVEIEQSWGMQFAIPGPNPAKPGPDSRCPPLRPISLSEPFEALRDAAARCDEQPKVYLATLGEVSDYAARVAFAQNLFASGGIEPHVGSADTYRGTKNLVALCSSDAQYAAHAADAVRALKAKGAQHVYLAGRPGELEAALKEAGVDEFIFAGCDAIDVLSRALEAA
ncbi:methylmalonyl-CoA mutase subunit beta [soil metagenome]